MTGQPPAWVQVAYDEYDLYQWQTEAWPTGSRHDLAVVRLARVTRLLDDWANR